MRAVQSAHTLFSDQAVEVTDTSDNTAGAASPILVKSPHYYTSQDASESETRIEREDREMVSDESLGYTSETKVIKGWEREKVTTGRISRVVGYGGGWAPPRFIVEFSEFHRLAAPPYGPVTPLAE